MKTTIMAIAALLLAIPTYGISLLIWIFLKYKYDKLAASRVLINAAVMSYNNGGENEIRFGINNAALPMLFDMFGGKIVTELGNSISGILPHPAENVMLAVTMSQVSGNRLLIKATGIDI